MPTIRADIIDVYIFRRPAAESTVELLQLLRTGGTVSGTWHPVMGHVEPGETAVDCALRELHEEVGLEAHHGDFLAMWALEQVHPFYIAQWDAVIMSPRFAVEVTRNWRPMLNSEHADSRWVAEDQAETHFVWPGQNAAIGELRQLLKPGSPFAGRSRVQV